MCCGEGRVFACAKKFIHSSIESFRSGGGQDFVLEVLALGVSDHGADLVSGGCKNLSVDSEIRRAPATFSLSAFPLSLSYFWGEPRGGVSVG